MKVNLPIPTVSILAQKLIFYVGIFVLVGSTSLAFAQNGPEHVIVVHSYHQGMEWTDGVTLGLQDRLKDRAELVFVYLDVKRFPGIAREVEMEAELAACVGRSRPRLIVTVDDFAYQFVLQRRAQLFPSCPIVFCGINYSDSTRPSAVSGVVEAIDISATLRLALTLQPKTRRVFVVNDRTETGRANRRAFEAIRPEFEADEIRYLGDGTFAEAEAQLAQLDPSTDIVLLLSWNSDRTGAVRTYETAVRRAREATSAAIYGVWNFYFSHGLVGGYLIDGHTHGTEAGEIAAQVLQGRVADTIPIVTRCRTKAVLDARELKRLGIPRDRVPPGVEVAFATPSLWQEHALLLTGVLAVVGLQGVTIGLLMISLAKRRRAEARAQASKEQLRLTLESSSDAVISTDNNGNIVLLNPVAAQLLACTQAESIGQPVWKMIDLRDPSGEQPYAPSVHVSILRNQAVLSGRAALVFLPDGGRRRVSFSAAPIRNAMGSILGMVLLVRDVTDSHRLEEQLRQAQKVESVGLLAGGIAHDFNNVLQVIDGNIAMLEDQSGLTIEHLELVDEIRRAAKRAGNLTRQLLAFGRKQQLVARDLDLAEVVDGLLKMLRRLISVEIALISSIERGRYFVRADVGQIEQVLLNLSLNARDAMPQGGKIRFELRHHELRPADVETNGWGHAGRFVVLSVSDSGTGMDRRTLERVFEPFFTTKPTGQGTGLGLAVVQGIVDQHGGFVRVSSVPKLGTKFEIYLQALAGPREAGELPESSADVRPGPAGLYSGTILLADDDVAVRKTIRGILRKQGFEVLAVSDGEAACAAAEAFEGPLAAVILDVVMPRMRGPEAANRIAATRPKVPVILCSGFPDSGDNQYQHDSRWHWLPKPFQANDLTKLLAESLGEAAQSGQSPPRSEESNGRS